MDRSNQQKNGFIAIASAFSIWGIVVIFWKNLSDYHSIELIAYRILWAPVFLLGIVALRGSFGDLICACKSPSQIRIHLINGILLAINWVAYVYAVTHEQILQGSLAYFMVPILNTCMGFFILKEKLNRLQWAAIALATMGVANEIVQFGEIPWLALIIAVSFAIYGMNKSRSKLGPMTALTLETGLLAPIAILTIIYLHWTSNITVHLLNPTDSMWMAATGIITIIPLLLFAYGAKRIQLATIGIFQFIAPSVKFFLGVFIYDEAFPPSKMITFACIWVALTIYLFHLFRSQPTQAKRV